MTDLNLTGTTLGRFAILDELGRGGMAVVYRATQLDLERIVALKILPPALTHDASYVARFRQEARAAARLEHPHIVPIYEVGEAGGLHYIAMKYIAGRTVKDVVEREGAQPVERAAAILTQVGEALDYAHRQGVIHRDIKPSNMMITEEGWVYLTDFGLARGTGGATAGLTMAGTVMGTPEYMSPEQAQGLPDVGPPSDIYALGVVLYELLTGAFPFKADTPMAMLAARLLQSPTPPRDLRGDLPTTVEDVVMRALARKPEARFPSAAAMVAALRASGVATPEPPRPQTPITGTPALGATIKVPGPPPANPAPTPAPYVQRPPQHISRPAAPAPAPTPAPGPAARPHSPGGLSLPYPDSTPLTLPPDARAPAPASKPRQGPSNLVIVLGIVAVLLLACVGMLFSFALRDNTTGPGTVHTAVADGDLTVALADVDRQAAEQETLPGVIALYEGLLAEYPDDPRVLGRLAVAASAGGAKADAAGYALRLADGPDPAAAALGHAVLAELAAWSGDVSGARAELEQARASAPDLALVKAVGAAVDARRAAAANSADELDTALAPLAGLAPADDAGPLLAALTHGAVGAAYAQAYALDADADAADEARAAYDEAIDLAPAAGRLRADLGALLVQREEYEEARDVFQEAVDAGYPAAHAGIGWAYLAEGEAASAEQAFDAAIAAAPGSPDGYYGKGRLRYDEDDYDGAITMLEQAADREGDDPVIQGWLGEAYFWKGFNGEGDEAREAFEHAASAYERAIALDERFVFAISGIAWTLQHQEQYGESVARFDEAIALDPENATHYDGKGWSLLNQDRAEEAEGAFREALALDERYVEAHYHLGRALEMQGRNDEARESYQRALELDPDHSMAREHIDALGE